MQNKKVVDRRVKVGFFTDINTRTSLIELFKNAIDQNSLSVLYRITSVDDNLVAAKGISYNM